MNRIKKLLSSFPFRIFLIALILRTIPVLAARDVGIGLDDMFQYDMLGRSIASGDGFRWYAQADLHLVQQYFELDMTNVDYDPRGIPTSFRPPFYPLFLAVVYSVFGMGADRFFIVRLIQAVIAALLAPMTYALARAVFADRENLARYAGWMIALYPMLMIFPLALATENIFFFLVLASLLMLFKAVKTDNPWHFVAVGVLLGFSVLTRSVVLIGIGVVFLWVWLSEKKPKAAVLLIVSAVLVMLPWMVRNTLLNGKISMIETSLGYQLYQGYHPESDGTFQYGISLDLLPILNDAERDRIGMQAVKQFIAEDPGRVPYLAVRRLGFFMGLERRAITYFYANNLFGYIPAWGLIGSGILLFSPFVIVSVSAVLGAASAIWNRRAVLLGLFSMAYLLPHVLILAEERFHMTLLPIFAVFAAFAWTSTDAIRRTWLEPRSRWRIVLAALIVALLFFNWGMELWLDREKVLLLLSPGGNTTYFGY